MGNPEAYKANLHPWIPEKDPVRAACLFKAGEECGELISAVSRCGMQGIEGKDEETGYPNTSWLEDEVADVYAILDWLMNEFDLDRARIRDRFRGKVVHFERWAMLIKEQSDGRTGKEDSLGERAERPSHTPGDGQ